MQCTRCDATPKRVRLSLAAASYRVKLTALVSKKIESAFAPLLRSLPRLAESSASARAGAPTRLDASPLDEASRMAKAAQAEFDGDFKKRVRREVDAAARNVTAKTKTDLRKKLEEHPDRRVNGIKLADSPRLRPIIEAFSSENVALITGIGPKLAADVQALVVAGLSAGTPHERLAERIRDRMGIAARRAEMIAIDQVGKLDGQLTAQRAQDVGVTHFFWQTSEDDRVRGNPAGKYPDAKPSHYERNGKRYAYADPPKGRNGEPELPGTPVGCRCTQLPDLSTANGAEPAQQQGSTEQAESEADRMVREVEAMLKRQQEEIAKLVAPQEPTEAPSVDVALDDPALEVQAQVLTQQLQESPAEVTETALARYRRWKRRGAQAQPGYRGDELAADCKNPIRGEGGLFEGCAPSGAAAPSTTDVSSPTDGSSARKQRAAARAELAAQATSAARRRAENLRPDEWNGDLREAEDEAEDANYELESAIDDLRDAETDEERAEASDRIERERDRAAVANARARVFREMIENNDTSMDPDADVEEARSEKEGASEGVSRSWPSSYPELDSQTKDQYKAQTDSVDSVEISSDPHQRVEIPFRWREKTIAEGSLGSPVSVEALSHAFAPPDGYTAVVDKVTDTEFSMQYKDKEGNVVGEIVREFRPNGEIHHSFLVLQESAQGTGFADVVNGQALKRYEKLGIKTVTVDAAWVGRYKWATMGFGFDTTGSNVGYNRSTIEEAAEKFFDDNDVDDSTRKVVRSLMDRPWELARFTDGKQYEVDFKSGPDRDDRSQGSFHLGKALLLHDKMPTWAGRLDIDRNNEAYLHALRKLQVEKRS